jgi:hypothetical protein
MRQYTLLLIMVLITPQLSIGQTIRSIRERLTINQATASIIPQSVSTAPPKMGKDPRKAFLFSVLLPGTGELYAGRKRALFFMALEVGGLATYVLMNRRGDERKHQVLAFADAHWDSTLCAPNCLDPSVGTEALGEPGSQQYYEQIGKYNKFQEGWDDYDPISTSLSSNRQAYVNMRHNMNKAYKLATWMAGAVLFNHVFSAIQAAVLVNMDNRSNTETQEARLRIRVDSFNRAGNLAPSAAVSYSF